MYIFGGLILAYVLKNKLLGPQKNVDTKIKNYFNNSIFIDVRSKEEYEMNHFNGAINIPYDTINYKNYLQIKDMQKGSNKNIVIYCRSGRRAKIAFDKLTSFGLENIYYTTFNYQKLNSFKQ